MDELTKYEVESVIKENPALFTEIFYERIVNNIYFDTADLNHYEENMAGNKNRHKMRIRWYGELKGFIEKPILEIKIKQGELGSKLSFPLKPFNLNESLSMEYLIKNVFNKSDLPEWLKEYLKHMDLSLLNSYHRKYFISADKKYRITFDFDLKYYRISQFINIDKKDCVILELKYPKEVDSGAHHITNNFSFRLTKSSKYVSGVDALDDYGLSF